MTTLDQAREALLAFGILPPPEPPGTPMSKARHYRAWCNTCHGNTLHKLDAHDARLLVCVKCALVERVSTTVLPEEEAMTIEAKLDETNTLLKAILGALTGGTSVTAGSAATDEKAETPKALTYPEVKEPFLALVKSHTKDFALDVLKKAEPSAEVDGVISLKNIEKKPESFATVLAAVQKAAAGPKPEKKKADDDLA